MATNVIFPEVRTLSVAVTDPAAPKSGDPVRVGDMTGLALTDKGAGGNAAANTTVMLDAFVAELSVKGVDGSGNASISVNDALFYNDGDTPKLSKNSGGYFYGIALETVNSGATKEIRVLHLPSPGAGTLAAGGVGTAQLAAGGVTAPKLSAAANSRAVVIPLGTVSATTSQVAFVAPVAGSLAQAALVSRDGVTADDTDFWTVDLTNKGAAGSETDAIASKTTKATGGEAIAAYTAWDLGALDATHKVLAAGDVVLLTLTKAASATALAEAALMLEFLPS